MGEERKVSFGFRLFLIFIEIIVTTAILGGAWLMDKFLVAPPLIVSLRLIRMKIETKYDVFHLASVFACMILSTLVCLIGTYISLPIAISLVSNIIVGTSFAIISWLIQDILNILKNYNTKDKLIAKCKDKGYDELKTQIAVKFFVDKEKPKSVWLWLCETQENPMSWDSVKNLKYKMKKDLF
jgi:hypothetical protein